MRKWRSGMSAEVGGGRRRGRQEKGEAEEKDTKKKRRRSQKNKANVNSKGYSQLLSMK